MIQPVPTLVVGSPSRTPAEGTRPGRGRVIAEALGRQLGGVMLPREPRRVVFRRRRYLLTPVLERGRRVICMGEWPGHADLPDWHARQRLLAVAAEQHPGAVLVCTDAAATRMVWGWQRFSPVAPPLQVEEHGSSIEEPRTSPPWAEGTPSSPLDPSPLVLEGAAAVAGTLLRDVRSSPSAARVFRGRRGETAAETLMRVVSASRDPAVARWVWRSIVRLRVLDPCCGEGDWLVGCLESLVAVALACLERMQAWVEPGAAASTNGNSGRLSDFRQVLSSRRGLSADGGRERLAYETVLLHSLHGCAGDAQSARAAVRKLVDRVPRGSVAPQSLLGEALVDVRVGVLRPSFQAREPARVRNGGADRGGAPGEFLQRAERLSRAEAQLARLRLELGGSLEELADGRRVIRSGREELRAIAREAGSGKGSECSLQPWLEYPAIAREGGFSLVRNVTVETRLPLPDPDSSGR